MSGILVGFAFYAGQICPPLLIGGGAAIGFLKLVVEPFMRNDEEKSPKRTVYQKHRLTTNNQSIK